GSWGLSDPAGNEGYTLSFDGNNLILVETGLAEDNTYTLTRVDNSSNGLTGTWEMSNTHTLVFLSDGYYFLIDTQRNTPEEDTFGQAGIEYGHNTTSGNMLAIGTNLIDTNASCGLYDTPARAGMIGPYTANATTLTLSPPGEPTVTFTRADYIRTNE